MIDRFDGLPSEQLPEGLTVFQAATHRARRRGLSRLEVIPADLALRIPTNAIHTFGMRFALDLIWLRKDGTVARVDRSVPPRRMRMCLKARSVVETLAGEADQFLDGGVGEQAPAGGT